MPTEILRRVHSDIQPGDHPYLQGAWTPLLEEVNATDLKVLEGRIPTDIDGVYLRNTQNPVYQAIGRYHPFDGDGMLHLLSLKDGKASYRNRFIQTKGLSAEMEAGRRLWARLMENPKLSVRPGWGAHGTIKDASSTDVMVHAGRAFTSYYQCGEGYRLDPFTLEQQGIPAWSPLDGVSVPVPHEPLPLGLWRARHWRPSSGCTCPANTWPRGAWPAATAGRTCCPGRFAPARALDSLSDRRLRGPTRRSRCGATADLCQTKNFNPAATQPKAVRHAMVGSGRQNSISA